MTAIGRELKIVTAEIKELAYRNVLERIPASPVTVQYDPRQDRFTQTRMSSDQYYKCHGGSNGHNRCLRNVPN